MAWINPDEAVGKEEKPKAIFSVDFDGTIVEGEYPGIGRPIPGAIEVLRELMAKGYRLILETMRSDNPLNDAVVYCNRNYIEFWGINKNPEQAEWTNATKIYANVKIDDTALGIPLMIGSNSKPCVDWVKLREILVSWEVLDPLVSTDDGTKTFEIK